MTKNWIGKLFITIVVAGLLVAGGFAAYRMGYAHGFGTAAADGDSSFFAERFENMPHEGYFDGSDDFSRDGSWMMPDSRFPGSHMDGFSTGYSPMTSRFDGHSTFFFSPFSILFRLAFFGFFIWLIVKLVKGFNTGTGWQLSFTRQPAAPEVVDAESKK